ncbi:MAG: hypothetical protein HQL09_01515 [Nitrospirae bacterium]|nr:hypothetical protein [Nitrospirota bacterium]
MKRILFNNASGFLMVFFAFFFAVQVRVSAEAAEMPDYEHHDHFMQGMEMPDMKAGKVAVEIKTEPASIKPGNPETITLVIKDAEGNPVQEITPTHDRSLHVIIASQDFTVFSHIHPEDFGPITPEMEKTGEYPVHYTFPKPGRYLIGVDLAVKDELISKHFDIDVAGEPGMGMPAADFSGKKKFGDYEVTLSAKPARIATGKEVTLTYNFTENGKPVGDLEPYIAAEMHVAIISTDLRQFMHEHGMLPGMKATEQEMHHMMMHHGGIAAKFGPVIEVHTVFPVRGVYGIFGQVMHRGKVILTRFMVEVE